MSPEQSLHVSTDAIKSARKKTGKKLTSMRSFDASLSGLRRFRARQDIEALDTGNEGPASRGREHSACADPSMIWEAMDGRSPKHQ